MGLHAAGFRNAVSVEVERIAAETLEANPLYWGRILQEDIHALVTPGEGGRPDASRILRAAGLRRRQADLLVGGPPCQPFSKSGYWARGDAARLNDPRARTLDAFLDVLEYALPKVFLLENVPGISFSAKDEGLAYIKRRIEKINEKRGVRYSFDAEKLNAAEYGVPQLRERVFVVGHREGTPFRYPLATHSLPPAVDMSRGVVPSLQGWQVPMGLEPALTAWDAIGHLRFPVATELAPRGKWAQVLKTIPEGANYLWHTDKGGGQISLWGWRTRYWSMLLKLAKNRPSWTLTATPGPAIGPFHWANRRLAAIEMAALQTFPPDYELKGNLRDATKQLGNAVPSALAELLGRCIREQYFDRSAPSGGLTLLPRRSERIPDPEPISPVYALPPEILALDGDYSPHLGTGRGPGAQGRKTTA